LERVGVGLVGYIYIGGEGIGMGYERRGGRTAERYVPDPWSGREGGSGGGRLYRTGDRGRRRRDGRVEYRGRVDRRVMVGGRRVEAEEIEGQLREHSGLKEVVVTVRGEVVGQEEKLAVWAVGVEGAGVVSAEVREYLGEKLGEGMVPERVTMVGEIARNEDGEGGVDYGALGRLLRGGGEAEYVAPGNEVEERVAEIWRETLGLERVGVKDNFFQVGGHSLLATQVVARMSSGFGVEIALRRLFESPTIAGLARIVERSIEDHEVSGKASAAAEPIRKVAREAVVLSS
jgi:acyl carrier protein